MLAVDTRGATVLTPSLPTPGSLTRSQLLARRNEDWRLDHEVGRLDPATGKIHRRPVWMIAALIGAPERTVRHGISEARRLREALANVEL